MDPLGTLAELCAALDEGRESAASLLDRSLARAEATEPSLRAFVRLRADEARAEARASDERRARGELRSAIDGIPIAVKDNLVKQGEVTTCGSKMLEHFVSPYDSTVRAALDRSGAIVVGTTNLDEFAMGSSTENSHFGPTRNPWDLERTPGGSSGGSAAVVAAGVVPLATGSDTGGSIRQPASFCGVVGVKPTYGRVSRYGLVAYASSLDQVGVFARTAADAALGLEAICGHDPRDSTSLPEPAPQLVGSLSGDVSDLVIGLPRECFELEGADPAVLESVRSAVSDLVAAGAKVEEVSLPHTAHAVPAYYLIATAEASSNLARFDGVRYGYRTEGASDLEEMYLRTRSEGFGDEVKRRIVLGTYVLSAGYYDAYYRKAQQVRTLLRRDFEAAFERCDVIATPTSPEVAFPIGERSDDPLRMYLSDIYTVSANLAGLPGVSLPCGLAGGLPVGLQLLAPALDEATLLRAADAYQRHTAHHEARPELS